MISMNSEDFGKLFMFLDSLTSPERNFVHCMINSNQYRFLGYDKIDFGAVETECNGRAMHIGGGFYFFFQVYEFIFAPIDTPFMVMLTNASGAPLNYIKYFADKESALEFVASFEKLDDLEIEEFCKENFKE